MRQADETGREIGVALATPPTPSPPCGERIGVRRFSGRMACELWSERRQSVVVRNGPTFRGEGSERAGKAAAAFSMPSR
jgi:hypothetical protein